eukprot:TRINITY_DN91619_c0_g1_i1.p1 TRINITY_DN91619_c0_g1~~TRINITY_DN91619_c0_g1_i1.p1  ORF type:complete len:225 (+),score=33.74 TRINITY_DN91619_c0_g1_i1:41-715(+)
MLPMRLRQLRRVACCAALLAAIPQIFSYASPDAFQHHVVGRPMPRVIRHIKPPTAAEVQQVIANAQEGKLGDRGEVFVAAQFAVLGCILFGNVPVVGDALTVLAGPGFMLLGLGLIVAGLIELRDVLSPWVVPAANTELKTSGVFAYVRHPLYAGLIAFSLGLSVATGSAARLVLTLVLGAILDRKATVEETALCNRYTDYVAYRDRVPAKILPSLDKILEDYA